MMCLRCVGTGQLMDTETCSDDVTTKLSWYDCPDCEGTGVISDAWFKRYWQSKHLVRCCEECDDHTYVAEAPDGRMICARCYAKSEEKQAATTVAATTM